MLITTYYATIGDDVTYRIGLLLSRYELSVKEVGLAIGLPQPRISHKLAKLRKYGCVNHHRDGQRVIYSFREPCRSVLLKGDLYWRKLSPEFAGKWQDDLAKLQKLLGDELPGRAIHPIIED